jgi:hypothetical protein
MNGRVEGRLQKANDQLYSGPARPHQDRGLETVLTTGQCGLAEAEIRADL